MKPAETLKYLVMFSESLGREIFNLIRQPHDTREKLDGIWEKHLKLTAELRRLAEEK